MYSQQHPEAAGDIIARHGSKSDPAFLSDEFGTINDVKPLLAPAAQALLEKLLELRLLSPASTDCFLREHVQQLARFQTEDALAKALVQTGRLTSYQVDRVKAGTTHGLVLGNYRVLERLGAGAMGVVFLAEHALMKRQAAVKVLPIDYDCPHRLLDRFYSEMRVLADFRHPHIVLAYDAGQVKAPQPGAPDLLYLVLELVPGGDLEQLVEKNGPLEIAEACEFTRQAASGLQEAHDHNLIHRDVKPSNLLLDQHQRVKVVDFGLVRQFCSQLTDARSLVGTLEFMAPEQSCDPSAVDGRADVYGLGATLFWLLTREMPFPRGRSVAESLRLLQTGRPRRVRELRPEAPRELDDLLASMLERDPSQRPAQPLDVMNALLPFCGKRPSKSGVHARPTLIKEPGPFAAPITEPVRPSVRNKSVPMGSKLKGKHILVVDDETSIRLLTRSALEPHGCACVEVADGQSALDACEQADFDMILLDLNLPDMDGYEVCRKVRMGRRNARVKIIVVSGRGDHNQLAESLPMGADDYIPKPFGIRQLMARVEKALELKQSEDQAEHLLDQLNLTNQQLENSLAARTDEVRKSQDALLFVMSKMAESGDGETPDHLRRMQAYTRCLALHVRQIPSWSGLINSIFLEQLERCVPLHDIGKIALPENVLLKPGKLDLAERKLMQTHTLIGDRILEALRNQHGASLTFLSMASAIVRSHHERYDGSGYPDQLSGQAIPAAARLVAVADVYDALRRRRQHKPELSHELAVHIMFEESSGQFDPELLDTFRQCEAQFAGIYDEIPT